MELKLKKAGYDYYEPILFAPFYCEVMREHIVPDSCADIARIVETTGQVRVTSREVTGDGRFCAGGFVDLSVLYIPEKGSGPCALKFQLPFQAYGDGRWDATHDFLDIAGEMQNVDTRLLNPRKILARVNVALYPAGCQHVVMSVCTDVQDDDSIQLLRETRLTRVIAAVREREFTVVEELSLSPGRGGAEEILSGRVEVWGTECKQIGSKLVVKGIAAATILYRETGGKLEILKQELPFSQILDGSGLEEDWENESIFHVLSSEYFIGGEGDGDLSRIITLTLRLGARVTVWRTEKVSFIADLYSTARSMDCETEEIHMRENYQRFVRRQNGREMLETGNAVRSVLDTEVICGSFRRGNDPDTVEVPVWGRCLYLDENDGLHSVRRECTVSCPMDREKTTLLSGTVRCRGDVMTSILPDGIELRFPLEFELETADHQRHLCVCGGGECEELGEEPCPSLVLRRLGRTEKLWSVAKQYRTTCNAILEVNGIEDEGMLPRDRLLLIPRCR